MDVPRLSTIQALLLLLKAREATPKRGYYYRSWMTIKTIVTMAKDLELHEHFAEHEAGRNCGSDPTECLIKTRIWQCIFACEIMVGGPQGNDPQIGRYQCIRLSADLGAGRSDFGVEPATVDMTIQRPAPGLDASDYQVSRQFTYMLRMVRLVRALNDNYRRACHRKDWGTDPEITKLNPRTQQWLDDLPSDLKPTFPDENATPWLPSHFVGNVHCYYHLLVIMLHRPQLMSSSSFSAGGSWKQHMALCYESAKIMCRLQEGILETYGLSGFLCMQRGINFVIYAVLTCTMIHLVSSAGLAGSPMSRLIRFSRWPSRLRTRIFTPMPRIILHDTCASSSSAHRNGPWRTCNCRLMRCAKRFRPIPAGRSS